MGILSVSQLLGLVAAMLVKAVWNIFGCESTNMAAAMSECLQLTYPSFSN